MVATATPEHHAPASPARTVTDDETPMAHEVTVEHTFVETAHRLPHLGGECTSLHGHSWQVTVTMTAPRLAGDGTVVEFGALKAGVRQWIDTYLDHGTMLGAGDRLVAPLTEDGSTVFRFGADPAPTDAETLATDLPWPSVEAVAVVLRRMTQHVLASLPCAAGARVGRVLVRETHRNAAAYEPAQASS